MLTIIITWEMGVAVAVIFVAIVSGFYYYRYDWISTEAEIICLLIHVISSCVGCFILAETTEIPYWSVIPTALFGKELLWVKRRLKKFYKDYDEVIEELKWERAHRH